MIDGYTTTDRYPYSQAINDERLRSGSGLRQNLNYVRNSVKVTIDAKIFGIGGIVETFVERSVKQSYENSAEFTDAWLAKKLAR